MEELSLDQAYEIIRLHLSEPTGFMDQIEHGLDIDSVQLHHLEDAIKRVSIDWKYASTVPKNIVQLFHKVFSRITRIIQLHPERRSELFKVYVKFARWIEMLFAEIPLSEEAAVAIVSHQIRGFQPLTLEFRFMRTINEDSLDFLLSALDTLVIAWKSKEDISKIGAHAMLNAEDIFNDAEKKFFSQGQGMEDASQKILTRIDACLS